MNTRTLVEGVNPVADRSLPQVISLQRAKINWLAAAAISIGGVLTMVWILFLIWLPGHAFGIW